MSRRRTTTLADVGVVTHGYLPHQLVDYARDRMGDLVRYAQEPISHVSVKLTYTADLSLTRPAQAQAGLDVSGRLLRGHVAAATPREAVDLLQARLRHRLSRMARHWEARRAGLPAPGPQTWRHACGSEHRPEYVPVPVPQRRVMRRKSYELSREMADVAVFDMEHLDYDVHLFVDERTGQEAVVYRGDPTGYGLARVRPVSVAEPATEVPLRVSPYAAPRLSEQQAVERLNRTGDSFLFFADLAGGRGRLLFRRHDGHYGLVMPAR